MRALILGNQGDSDPGLVGLRLSEIGFVFNFNEREYPRQWKSTVNTDLVLLLGSDWSVYWEANAKEVAAEVDLVRRAMERGIPTFAICYGAQIIAHAFGGNVSRLATPEVGWHEVSSTEYPELLAGEWLQWHYDTFVVPPGFTTLARNSFGPQTFMDRRILATQFHPEATIEIVSRWCSGAGQFELQSLGIDTKNLIDASANHITERIPVTASLVDWFLTKVAS